MSLKRKDSRKHKFFNHIIIGTFVGLLGITTTPCHAQPIIESLFDNNDEGWTVFGDAQEGAEKPNHHVENGNQNGYISANDNQVGGVWYWRAPEKYLGDISSAYGGTFTFDLKQSQLGGQ